MTHLSIVHLHLAINHSPLFAELFAFFFILIGLLKKNRGLVTSGLVICIVAALCAGATYWSGDEASDIIDQSPPIAGLEKTMIGEHALAAGWSLTASCITAVLAIVTLFVRRRWLEIVVLIFLAWSLSVVARTALLGGRIHHPEVRAVVKS